MFGENGSALRVPADILIFGMLSAIQLDNQIGLATGKIRDVGTNRLLPDELEVQKSTISQPGPEFALSVGRIGPQSLGGAGGELGFEDAHGKAPSPAASRRPLPPGRG